MSLDFDVVVAGSGPAGSVAALTLARAGARVALVDKQSFPRQKACGDAIGPRGVALLDDLGVDLPGRPTPGVVTVVGPSGSRATLPPPPGRTYGQQIHMVPRVQFDAALRDAAVDAGAVPVAGQVRDGVSRAGRLGGVELVDGTRLHVDFVVGADGALSRVAEVAGLVDPRRVLWGFALRAYAAHDGVSAPHLVFWSQRQRRMFPGYGWVFPAEDGSVNVGLGVGAVGSTSGNPDATRREHARLVARGYPAFLRHLQSVGLLDDAAEAAKAPRLGGWLKMGLVGTVPARGRTLLVGDAAGLVNPLQGEGIAQAMASGRRAAQSIIADPARAAEAYTAGLLADRLPFHQVASWLHQTVLRHPRAGDVFTRALTSRAKNRLASVWSVLWSELLDDAVPTLEARVARNLLATGAALTRPTETGRWFRDAMTAPSTAPVPAAALECLTEFPAPPPVITPTGSVVS